MTDTSVVANSELLVEIAEVILYTLGSGFFGVLGVFTETVGLQNVSAGQVGLGAWYVAFGSIVLAMGILIATRELYPRLAQVGRAVRSPR